MKGALAAAFMCVFAIGQGHVFDYGVAWPLGKESLVADIDGDGVAEVLQHEWFWSAGTGHAFFYRALQGNGLWSQAAGQVPRTELNLVRFEPLAVADFDGDGHVDVFMDRWRMGLPPNELSDVLLLGDGRGGMRDASNRMPATLTWLYDAEALDIEGDGDLDIFASGPSGTYVYVNDGAGAFTDESATRLLGGLVLHGHASASVDADLDGDLDVFVANGITTQQPSVVWSNDAGVFTPVVVGSPPSWGYAVILVDANSDGHDDVIQCIAGVPPTPYLASPGATGMVAAPALRPAWPSPYVPTMSTASDQSTALDWDGAGDRDVWLTIGNRVVLWENTGSGFVDISNRLFQPPTWSGAYHLVLDYDLDGDDDVLVAGDQNSGNLYVSRVRAARALTPPTLGGQYAVEFTARANHAMLGVLGIAPARFQVPGLGWVFLDPAQSAFVGSTFFATHSNRSLSVAVPNQPALTGFAVGMQGIDVDLTTGLLQTTTRPSSVIR